MSNYQNWVYTRNPFVRVAKYSFERLYAIVVDHESKLAQRSNDPQLSALYQRFLSISTTFKAAYVAWQSALDFQVVKTAQLDTLLSSLLKRELFIWDAQIQVDVPIFSEEYRALMRGGRSFYHNAKKDIRISGVRRLAENLKEYPNLASLQADVEAFAVSLENLRDEQKRRVEITRTALQTLRELRDDACTMLFRNLAMLLDLYPNNPQRVTNFFLMELVRSSSNTSLEEETETEYVEEEPTSEMGEEPMEVNPSEEDGN